MEKNIEIKNWKEVVDQFGLRESEKLVGAVHISRRLRLDALKNNCPDVVCVECSKQSEAICIFRIVSKDDTTAIYEYEGTAN